MIATSSAFSIERGDIPGMQNSAEHAPRPMLNGILSNQLFGRQKHEMHLATAKRHFEEDIARARALEKHACRSAATLQADILRASWMFAVGATDAYFSDAYADLIARTLRAVDIDSRKRKRKRTVKIPDRLSNLKLPVVAVIRQAGGGWRWRMAARELIEDKSVLSLKKIRELFNQFLRPKSKLVNWQTIGPWILHAEARMRCFGISSTQYRALKNDGKTKARKDASKHFQTRIATIFKRRHDCIHNCDRPKVAPQNITPLQVQKITEDLCFLVERTHDALSAEFPMYLDSLGFSAATRNQVLI